MQDETHTVLVYLNGDERYVPDHVETPEDARSALRVPPGLAVAYACAPDTFLLFDRGHVFIEGERYITRGLDIVQQPQLETTVDESGEPSLNIDFQGLDADWWKGQSDDT